jgi:hypothetical protein
MTEARDTKTQTVELTSEAAEEARRFMEEESAV